MDSRHSTLIHISSVEVHYPNENKLTLLNFPYQMLWHKYDPHVASLYFYMLYICNVLSHHTFFFDRFGFYPRVFQIPITPG